MDKAEDLKSIFYIGNDRSDIYKNRILFFSSSVISELTRE